MDLGPGTDADLLQRALDGEPVERPGVIELVAILHAVSAIDQARLAPRDEFVADLRGRLLSEAHPIAASATTAAVETDAGSAEDGNARPVSVLHVSRPVRRFAAAAAAVIVLAGGLGVASRQAAPGDLLYPIKQVLDRAAVELAGGRLELGRTHLAQAEQHVSEARELIDRGDPAAEDLTVAFDAAAGSTASAQSVLLDLYRSEGRPEALTEFADFVARALPQVEAMRLDVPPGAVPAWERLRDLLTQGGQEALRELASCSTCGEAAAANLARLELLLGSPTGTTPDAGVAPALPTLGDGLPGTPGAPGATATAPLPADGATLPGITVAPPPATIGSATVRLPGAVVTSSSVSVGGGGVTLPSATVSLPTLVVSSTVVGGGGGATLPGVTVTAPTLSVTLAPTLP